MTDLKKYEGIIPAFYACYDAAGNINPTAVRELTRWFIEKGVQGVYVGGSSGECIYQSKEERKLVLENVMAEAKGKLTVIAHIACNLTTADPASWLPMPKAWALMPSPPFLLSTSSCLPMPLPSTGMT